MSKQEPFIISVYYFQKSCYGQKGILDYYENCVLVKGKIAQLVGKRFKPLMYSSRGNEEQKLIRLLLNSCGSLNKENYTHFLPYMLSLDTNEGGYMVSVISPANYAIIKGMG